MTKVTTHAIHFDEAGFHEDILDQPFIPEAFLKTRRSFLWIHLEGERDIHNLRPLFDELGLDNSHLHTLHDLNQRPRVELYQDYAHCVSKFELLSQKTKKRYAKTTEKITLFFNENFVLTYHPSTRPIFTGTRESLKENAELRRKGPVYLAYTLLDTIIDAYEPTLESYETYIDHLEDVVIDKPNNKTFLAIHDLKKQLSASHSAFGHMIQAIDELTFSPPSYLRDENLDHFEKLNDEAHHSLDRINAFRDDLSGLVDLFFSSQGSKLNDLLKILTLVSMIFVPIGFLIGIWGLPYYDTPWWNFFELKRGFGYWVVGCSSLIIAGSMLWYFKRKGWMDEDSPHIPKM